MTDEEILAKLAKGGEEPVQNEKLRMFSLLFYIIVLIGFGIPIWWHTTKVYRASLPLEEMLVLHSIPPHSLNVLIHASTLSRSQLLTEELQNMLGTTVNVSIHDSKVSLPVSANEEDIDKAASSGMMEVREGDLLLIEWAMAPSSLVLTSSRVIYFKSDISGHRIAVFLGNWPGIELKTALVVSARDSYEKKVMRPLLPAPKYDILITVVNPEPHNLKVEWDVKSSINEYLQPFLDPISDVIKFTAKSQWLYLVELGVNPRNVGDHYALAEQLLSHIISPLEKKLSSHVSKDPCINLVVYVPSCRFAPIHIYNRAGVRSRGPVDAFVSPLWGGVVIANPTTCPNATFSLDSKLIMSTFITHINQLLGLPDLAVADEIMQTKSNSALWQKDYLMRAHTIQYIEAARLSLRSLAQLLLEINNIVINDDVAHSVKLAVSNIAESETFLDNGDVYSGFKAAQLAALSAEAAFTDPSLLALLYFPDDQKYAVYIPLFLPVMIPVVVSMYTLVKWVKKNTKKD